MRLSVKERDELLKKSIKASAAGAVWQACAKEIGAYIVAQGDYITEKDSLNLWALENWYHTKAKESLADAQVYLALSFVDLPVWLIVWDWVWRKYFQYKADTAWLRESWGPC